VGDGDLKGSSVGGAWAPPHEAGWQQRVMWSEGVNVLRAAGCSDRGSRHTSRGGAEDRRRGLIVRAAAMLHDSRFAFLHTCPERLLQENNVLRSRRAHVVPQCTCRGGPSQCAPRVVGAFYYADRPQRTHTGILKSSSIPGAPFTSLGHPHIISVARHSASMLQRLRCCEHA